MRSSRRTRCLRRKRRSPEKNNLAVGQSLPAPRGAAGPVVPQLHGLVGTTPVRSDEIDIDIAITTLPALTIVRSFMVPHFLSAYRIKTIMPGQFTSVPWTICPLISGVLPVIRVLTPGLNTFRSLTFTRWK